MSNPFTDESRDARLSLDVDLTGRDGLGTKLRSPESIATVVAEKPAHVSTGTWALKGMLDALLIADIVAGRYRHVQATLDTLFGPAGTDGTVALGVPRKPLASVPPGTRGASRSREAGGILLTLLVTAATVTLLGLAALHALLAGVLR